MKMRLTFGAKKYDGCFEMHPEMNQTMRRQVLTLVFASFLHENKS